MGPCVYTYTTCLSIVHTCGHEKKRNWIPWNYSHRVRRAVWCGWWESIPGPLKEWQADNHGAIPGCSLSHCGSHFDIALHLLAGVASDHTLIFCGGRLGSHCAVCAVLEFPRKTSWPWICSAPLPLFPECWDWRRGHSACRCYLCSPVCKSFTPHTLGALLQHSHWAVVSLEFKDGFYSSLLTPSIHPGNAQSLLWTHSFYLSNSAWLRSCLNFPFLSPQPGHFHLGSKRWLITGLTSFKYHFSGITALSVWCSVPEGC